MNLLSGLLHSVKLVGTQVHAVEFHGSSAFSFQVKDRAVIHLPLDAHSPINLQVGAFRCELNKGQYAFAEEGADQIVGIPNAKATQPLAPLLRDEEGASLRVIRVGKGPLRARMLVAQIEIDRVKLASVVRLLPNIWENRLRHGPVTYTVPPLLSLDGLAECGTQFGGSVLLEGVGDILYTNAIREQIAKGNATALLTLKESNGSIAKALRAIYRNPTRNWTIRELASEACMSRSSFAAAFTHSVGTSPIEYLTRIRMARAEALMRHSPYALAQIAALIGYSSESSFNRAFRRFSGVSPGVWRRNSPGSEGNRKK